jgi:hypothetical protein
LIEESDYEDNDMSFIYVVRPLRQPLLNPDLLWKQEKVYTVAISPDGMFVALGKGYYQVEMHDIDGKLIWESRRRSGNSWDYPYSLSVSKNGVHVLVTFNGIVEFLGENGTIEWEFATSERVITGAISKDGRRAVVGGVTSVFLLDVEKRELVWRKTIGKEGGWVHAHMSDDNDFIVAAKVPDDSHGSAYFGLAVSLYAFDGDGNVGWSKDFLGLSGFAVSSQSRHVVTISRNQTVCMLGEEGRILWSQVMPVHRDWYETPAWISDNGEVAVVLLADGNLHVLDNSGKTLGTYPLGYISVRANKNTLLPQEDPPSLSCSSDGVRISVSWWYWAPGWTADAYVLSMQRVTDMATDWARNTIKTYPIQNASTIESERLLSEAVKARSTGKWLEQYRRTVESVNAYVSSAISGLENRISDLQRSIETASTRLKSSKIPAENKAKVTPHISEALEQLGRSQQFLSEIKNSLRPEAFPDLDSCQNWLTECMTRIDSVSKETRTALSTIDRFEAELSRQQALIYLATAAVLIAIPATPFGYFYLKKKRRGQCRRCISALTRFRRSH